MSDSNNLSVIICESPSPVKNVNLPNNVTNYRKRLRSGGNSRALIETPYESPLNHFKRNLKPISETNEEVDDITVVSTPHAKRRKTNIESSRQLFNLDDSVVVVVDERPKDVAVKRLDNREIDVVEVAKEGKVKNLANLSLKKKGKVKATSKGKSLIKGNKALKQKRQKGPKAKDFIQKSPKNRKSAESLANSLTVNNENDNGQIMESRTNEDAVATASDVEEIEVVWSSRPDPEPADTEVYPIRSKTSPQEPIVIDVVPTVENAWYNEFDTNMHTNMMSSRSKSDSRTGVNKKTNKLRKPKKTENSATGRLREIVIDGSNVAMGHSRNKTFSEKGLQIVIDYFKSRGHPVKVFLPQSSRTRGRKLIEKLHVEGTVVFTPSRTIAGRKITPYDDRYILEYATQCNGIVISSDQYRDLWDEKPQWRNTIENRLLAPTFVGDYLMFPEDPLGRAGPKLEQFLRY